MGAKRILSVLLIGMSINCFPVNQLKAQQVVVDSSLLQRITELEKQVAYKKAGEDHFMVAGLVTFGFVANKTTSTIGGVSQVSKTNSLADADHYEFSPMLLWRHGHKFLMEFEPSFDGSSLSVNWAAVSYFAAPGLIIRGGYFVLPFGTYNKRLAAGWIDKLPTDPTGLADLPPGSDFGIEVEGGLPLGNMKWSYDISLTNGHQLLPDGEIHNTGVVDNNNNKTITARLALLPFSNSSLEIGVSGLFGKVGDAGSLYAGAKANMYAADLNYVKLFSPIMVNIKGQYNFIKIDKQTYTNPADTSLYSFDNKTNTGYAQISLRPIGSGNNIVRNIEAAFRIGNFNTPEKSLWGNKQTITEAGLLYWITWRTVIKAAYTINKSASTSIGTEGDTIKSNSLIIQFSILL